MCAYISLNHKKGPNSKSSPVDEFTPEPGFSVFISRRALKLLIDQCLLNYNPKTTKIEVSDKLTLDFIDTTVNEKIHYIEICSDLRTLKDGSVRYAFTWRPKSWCNGHTMILKLRCGREVFKSVFFRYVDNACTGLYSQIERKKEQEQATVRADYTEHCLKTKHEKLTAEHLELIKLHQILNKSNGELVRSYEQLQTSYRSLSSDYERLYHFHRANAPTYNAQSVRQPAPTTLDEEITRAMRSTEELSRQQPSQRGIKREREIDDRESISPRTMQRTTSSSTLGSNQVRYLPQPDNQVLLQMAVGLLSNITGNMVYPSMQSNGQNVGHHNQPDYRPRDPRLQSPVRYNPQNTQSEDSIPTDQRISRI